MLGVCAHLYMIAHLCMFMSDLPQQVSAGAVIRIYSFLSVSFLQATKECVEHPHVQGPNQCESGERKIGKGETMQGERVVDSMCASACVLVKGRGKRERNKRESKMRQQGKECTD